MDKKLVQERLRGGPSSTNGNYKVFREKNIAHRVDMRARFKRIAERLGCGPPD
jgi:hypothetical protein